MSKITIGVDITQLDLYEEIVNTIGELIKDERIDSTIRDEYKAKILAITDKHINKCLKDDFNSCDII